MLYSHIGSLYDSSGCKIYGETGLVINGVFYLSFRSAMGILGNGLAVFEDGVIRGGDDSYLYSGQYIAEDNNNLLTAHVDVQYYQGEEGSIFGSKESFQLELSGSFTKRGIKANGHVVGQPSLQMSLEGNRVEDAYSSMIPKKVPSSKGSEPLSDNQIRVTHSKTVVSNTTEAKKRNQPLLEDPFNLLNRSNYQSFYTAAQLHSSGKYLDALKVTFPIIEASVNTLLQRIGRQPEEFNGLRKKVKELGRLGAIPQHIVHSNDIVCARNVILHGNYAPPDDYLYPISLLAFQHLHCLLTECNLST